MRYRSLHLIVALALLLVAGLVHGNWTNRWATTATQSGKALLDHLDREVGEWRTGDFIKIDPAELPPHTRCDSRRFLPLRGNKAITVSLTSGSPSAVAVHTPDVCFLGAGWKLRGAVTRQAIPLANGQNASFWVGDFIKTSATGTETIRVRWTWTADGEWQAPDYPRWIFARAPILYKLYMVHPMSDDEDLTRDDPYRKFVADLMPALSQQIH